MSVLFLNTLTNYFLQKDATEYQKSKRYHKQVFHPFVNINPKQVTVSLFTRSCRLCLAAAVVLVCVCVCVCTRTCVCVCLYGHAYMCVCVCVYIVRLRVAKRW